MMLVSLSLTGCGQKIVIKNEIPSYLLEVPKIDINRTISTNADVAIFMLDIFEAYGKCTINLTAIKELQDGKNN